ncbi:hypothetical protein CDIK_4594, partial [Cucumispora dikerogammari]
IKNKHNFGTPKTIRWLNRFNNYNFKVIYREGDKMQIPDALSRAAIEEKPNCKNKNKDYDKLVLGLHKKFHHRKNIKSALKDKGINLPKEKLRVILKKCKDCMKYDPKRMISGKHIQTYYPCEVMSCDLMEVKRGKRIISIIDYFSRKINSRVINTKEPKKIIKFLTHMHSVIPIRTLLTDNGGEFKNK